MLSRRNWLRNAAGLVVAPFVVRADNIMRVTPVIHTGPATALMNGEIGVVTGFKLLVDFMDPYETMYEIMHDKQKIKTLTQEKLEWLNSREYADQERKTREVMREMGVPEYYDFIDFKV